MKCSETGLSLSVLLLSLALLTGCEFECESEDAKKWRSVASMPYVYDADDRCEVVQELTDQHLLGQIAAEDESADVRVAAVSKLTDQAVLQKIVEDGDNWERVRADAVERLDDQTIRARLAMEDKSEAKGKMWLSGR